MNFIKYVILLFFVFNSFSFSQNDITSTRQNAITRAVAICSPAIVGINVIENKVGVVRGYSGDRWFDYFYGPQSYYKQYQVSGGGSGFLISSDGFILTNHHVAGNASKIVVTLTNGEKYDADVIGSDLTSDICLLKIKGSNFQFLKFADSDKAIVGEWAIAMGNPFGLFDYNAKPVVTVGVVSNKGISFVQNEDNNTRIYKDMIQTDASISSGNSGGPLLNSFGEVIGMNTIIFTTTRSAKGDAGSIGIGFAVPTNRIKRIVELLKIKGKIDRNMQIGIEVRNIDTKLANYYKLPKSEGIFVYKVENRSAASYAGIEAGDIIDKINDKQIIKTDDIFIELGDALVGDKLNFEIIRGSKRLNLIITIPQLSYKRQ